jgi:hypothetical protein
VTRSAALSGALAELRSPVAIRQRAARVLQAGALGKLAHFAVDETKLREVARFTAQVTRKRYPDLRIPPHSRFGHFDAGGVARLAAVERDLAGLSARQRARSLTDLVVVSVLVDAGAGDVWRYREVDTGLTIGRSEGLAIASLAWVKSGALSSRGAHYEVDADGLMHIDKASLASAFQDAPDNPLVGLEGRLELLRALGRALLARPDVFGSAGGHTRIGGLIDALCSRAQGGALAADQILALVLDSLGGIWPGRLSLDGEPLGDVWRHPAAGGEGETAGLMPFHKLSQWLSYSLIHALEAAQLQVRELDALTGLAEYRNGGLFVDLDVLVPKHDRVLREAHAVDSELIVEWRALTVALLDKLAPLVREELGVDAARLPLPAMLEGGTWAAGREIAKQRRQGGGPPITVTSDGTVF